MNNTKEEKDKTKDKITIIRQVYISDERDKEIITFKHVTKPFDITEYNFVRSPMDAVHVYHKCAFSFGLLKHVMNHEQLLVRNIELGKNPIFLNELNIKNIII